MEPQNQPANSNPQPIIEPVKKCNHLPIIVVLAILAICGFGFGGFELWQNMKKDATKYYFEDHSEPGGKYYVEINYNTKSLFVKEVNYCSAVDCQSDIEENIVILNNDELTKIKQIIAMDVDESSLGGVLSSLAKNNKIMKSKDDREGKDWPIYAEDDLNMDGVVTYREFGNVWLNDIISEGRG